MCRIAGIIQNGDAKITPTELKNLLLAMEYGGRDATGMAFILDNEIVYSKAKGKASQVIKEDFVDKIAPVVSKAKAILLHTRSATHGSPKDNRNNHPIIGKQFVMVHNGIVETDQKYRANGQTDTEQMLMSIETHGIEKGLNKTTGWVATLFADIETCDKVYWYTNPSGSLSIAQDERGIWILASTKSIISEAIKTTLEEYKIEDNTVYEYCLSQRQVRIPCKPHVKSAYAKWYNMDYWKGYGKGNRYLDCAYASSPLDGAGTPEPPWYLNDDENAGAKKGGK
jgi:predicted glutamine amidotransferase